MSRAFVTYDRYVVEQYGEDQCNVPLQLGEGLGQVRGWVSEGLGQLMSEWLGSAS